MSRKLNPLQTTIMALLTKSPHTIHQLMDATGAPDGKIRNALFTLKESYGCVHITGYTAVNKQYRRALYAAGPGEDAPYPYHSRDPHIVLAQRVKDELRAQAVELQKKKEAAAQEAKALLCKQNTPFGWLLENANG